jgi:hypothetical protein
MNWLERTPKKGPLYQHLSDAIKLNRNRLTLYSNLTQGKSESLSRRLIAAEMFSLPAALILDGLTHPYRKMGILIGDAEYVDMKEAPEFQPRYPFEPEPLNAFIKSDLNQCSDALRKELKNANEAADFKKIKNIAVTELTKFEHLKAYHCMVKHILESIARAAHLAPIHHESAINAGQPSTLKLSKWIIWGHLPALSPASDLDADLAPIQATGVPMLWQDVPKIEFNRL